MFDIGGWEFLIIILVAIVVVGPKDLPALIRNVTGWVRKARELARDFQSGLNDIARESELDSVRREVTEGLGLDDGENIGNIGNRVRRDLEHSIDPDDEIRDAFDVEDYFDDPIDDADIADADEDAARRIGDARRKAEGADGGAADEDGFTPPAEDAAPAPADGAGPAGDATPVKDDPPASAGGGRA